MRELEQLVADVEKTYSPSRPHKYRTDLATPLFALAEAEPVQGSDASRRNAIDLAVRSLAVRDGVVRVAAKNVVVKQAPLDVGPDAVSTLLACARRFACRKDPRDDETALA